MVAKDYRPPWFSIAPMMELTNHHYRTIARLITKHAWLWTEMLAAETIVYQKDNLDRYLAFSPDQHPIVLQIGGNDLGNLATAVKLARPYGYDEINFNCGCPSPKVAGEACFGVTLMLDPEFVGKAMSVIAANSDVPVSVKCRIGVDSHDSYNELCNFIYKVSSMSPTRHFIIHSRKALLNGISPAENRRVPPLRYEYFYALLRDFPNLRLTINGGIVTIDENTNRAICRVVQQPISHLLRVNSALKAGAHGVMVGRAAYNNPWQILGHVDSAVYGIPWSGITRRQILETYQQYADSVIGSWGCKKPGLRDLAKPILGLFHSEPRCGLWKRHVDAAFSECKTMKSLLEKTLPVMPDYVLDKAPMPLPPSSKDPFANILDLLPAPYTFPKKELLYDPVKDEEVQE